MDRREFLKMSALAGGFSLVPSWLTASEYSQASSNEVRSNNGELKLNLVASEGLIPFGKSKRWAMTYNGVFPGPTLRIVPGDNLKIKFTNRLNEPTNLHTHGLHTSPIGNGDNPFLMINPGASFNYSIKVPQSQKSGTFWYHPHHHELSAGQVSSGLAGAIIVEDAIDQLPLIRNSKERIIILADPKIGGDSSIATPTRMDLLRGRSGIQTLVNGFLIPQFISPEGSIEYWRVLNSCVTRYQTLRVPGAGLTQISVDSSRLPVPVPVDSITLAPGQRTEFLVNAPRAGTYQFQSGAEKLASIKFLKPNSSLERSSLLPFKKILKIDGRRSISIVGGGMGMMSGGSAFTFDGRVFNPGRVDQKVRAGTTEEWVITNNSMMHHPFHLHAWPFQVADDGYGNYLLGWHDTVNIPGGATVRIRIPFTEITGRTVYHCHILDHEDAGMMGIVDVA
jgi:FtsP/CotA-like multicopper oxidase with cupredoxin domain